jgi:hypothetical protein
MTKRTYDTPLFNDAKMNKHTYYCSENDCNNETNYNGGLCHEHTESLSYETSECPGCGNDIYCGANGYCSNCWAERFGCESPISHTCSGEWDYDRGIRECDDNEYHRKNCESDYPRRNSIESHYERSCASCHENFTSKVQTTCCGECHIDASVVIQKWWRNHRRPFEWCNLWFQGHCRSCKTYFPTQREYDVYCAECRESVKLPNLPPSPIDEIEEKLRQTNLSRDDVLNPPCHECGNSNCDCSPSEAD